MSTFAYNSFYLDCLQLRCVFYLIVNFSYCYLSLFIHKLVISGKVLRSFVIMDMYKELKRKRLLLSLLSVILASKVVTWLMFNI